MKKSTFLIAAKHAVTEALKNPYRKVIKVFLTEDSKKTLNKDYENRNLLKGVNLLFKTRRELDRLCAKDEISHQGLIAELEHLEKQDVKKFLISNESKKNPIENFCRSSEKSPLDVFFRKKNIGNINRQSYFKCLLGDSVGWLVGWIVGSSVGSGVGKQLNRPGFYF